MTRCLKVLVGITIVIAALPLLCGCAERVYVDTKTLTEYESGSFIRAEVWKFDDGTIIVGGWMDSIVIGAEYRIEADGGFHYMRLVREEEER